MRLYDITVPISQGMPVWPGDPAVEIARVARIEDGSPSNVSQLRLGSHTGTHIDAPRHFLPDGRPVDRIPVERLVGRAWLADCRGVSVINADGLQRSRVPDGISRLLVLTDNSRLWDDARHRFVRGFVALDSSAAHWIVERRIQLIGVDYASVDPFGSEDFPAHRILLPNDVIIIENLDLRHVPPGEAYRLMCLPLKIEGCDGAPARVILGDLTNEET